MQEYVLKFVDVQHFALLAVTKAAAEHLEVQQQRKRVRNVQVGPSAHLIKGVWSDPLLLCLSH